MTGPFQPAEPCSDRRFHVYEFVCDHGLRIQQAHAEGTRTIRMVLRERPEGCLYAILHVPGAPELEVIVADLTECLFGTDGLLSLGRHWVFPTLEAARAATVMQYGVL